jgi:aminoglycoside phosphotransferase (APT) family kinase protein
MGSVFELVDADVSALIDYVHTDPGWLAAALLERPATLVHGDLKFANLGADGAQPILLDWGPLTTWAPPAVDFAWYLAINAAATGRSVDEVRDEIRRTAQGETYDERAESLALVGALAQLGWEKALGATSDDPAVARRERAGLAWWSAATRAITR